MTTMIEVTARGAAAPQASQPQSANPNKALWEKGDFTRIARTMRESGEARRIPLKRMVRLILFEI